MYNELLNGEPVTLVDMLEAREARQYSQNKLLNQFPEATLVVMTLNIPGPIKMSAGISQLAHSLITDISQVLDSDAVIYQSQDMFKTGCVSYWMVKEDKTKLKRTMVSLEVKHPLGRLMDLDVLTLYENQVTPLSRFDIGELPRSCFVCGREAKVCARSQAHSLEEIQAYIIELVSEYMPCS